MELVKKISSFVLLGFVLVVSVYYNDAQKSLTILGVVVTIIAYLHFDEIKIFSMAGVHIERLEKAKEEYNELSEETKKLLRRLQIVTTGLSDFSLALLEKDGEFDNVTDFDVSIDFVESIENSGYDKIALENKLNNCAGNLIHSFDYKAKELYNVEVGGFYNVPDTISEKYSSDECNKKQIDLAKMEAASSNENYQKMFSRLKRIVTEYSLEE